MEKLTPEQEEEFNRIANGIVAKVLVMAHVTKNHTYEKKTFCPLCNGDTFKAKMNRTIPHQGYTTEGEIYEILKVKHCPASYMAHESFMYCIRLNDKRIAWYLADYFDIVTD